MWTRVGRRFTTNAHQLVLTSPKDIIKVIVVFLFLNIWQTSTLSLAVVCDTRKGHVPRFYSLWRESVPIPPPHICVVMIYSMYCTYDIHKIVLYCILIEG